MSTTATMESSLWSHLFSSTDGLTVDPSFEDSAALAPPPGFDTLSGHSESTTRLFMGSHSNGSTAIAVIPADGQRDGHPSTSEPSIPRRNLTEAFEELYVETPATDDTVTPEVQPEDIESSNASKTSIVSPTGVAELHASSTGVSSPVASESSGEESALALTLPSFSLHPLLQRDLSQSLVNRVSLHSIIHDVNKEATSMAANDDSSFSQTGSMDEDKIVTAALIDEEKWLLSVIEARDLPEVDTVSACPPTFLQAMGEKEYDSSLSTASRETNRTTLWKPSRSWWEAKSGKNPWIEPSSHNKRWRFLWPLIHYHKLLTKCIKKLKRNGVDVKTSVSPVAVFLREDVCAVSDHLAAVSLYDSAEWMDCLSFFRGWTDTDPKSEKRLRSIISSIELRPLSEPQDVDSALLRNQIDEKFLRAMSSAREQIDKYRGSDGQVKTDGRPPRHFEKSARRKFAGANQNSLKTPSGGNISKAKSSPRHLSLNSSKQLSMDAAKHRWGYPSHGGQWWGGGWPQYAYCDETSVHSALTHDSHTKPQHQNGGMYTGYGPHAPPFYPPPMTREQYEYYYGHVPQYSGQYHHQVDPAFADSGWVGHPRPCMDPGLAYGPPQQTMDSSGYMAPPGTPGGPSSPYQMVNPFVQSPAQGTVGGGSEGEHTPFNYDPSAVPVSPFFGEWRHIDAAIMQGLMTPGKASPHTPPRETSNEAGEACETREDSVEFAKTANPLLINGSHYYHFGYGAQEGYAPPSPATQFMMSPSNPGSVPFYPQAQSYGSHGFSPRRSVSHQKKPPPSTVAESSDIDESTAPTTDAEEEGVVTPPPAVRKMTIDESVEASST